jgi:RNA polymerase sigma-70 factor, ECF subfamily
VLLKDVFDHSLEEIADLVDSTVGGVITALSRGRGKLKTTKLPTKPKALNPEVTQLLQLYVERFNRHDWDGLRELISADAHLRVADAFSGRLSDSPYFGVYENWPWEPWRMTVGEIDAEPAVIILRRGADAWKPYSAIRLDIVNERVTAISDYWHAPWILESGTATVLNE